MTSPIFGLPAESCSDNRATKLGCSRLASAFTVLGLIAIPAARLPSEFDETQRR